MHLSEHSVDVVNFERLNYAVCWYLFFRFGFSLVHSHLKKILSDVPFQYNLSVYAVWVLLIVDPQNTMHSGGNN